MGKTTRTTKSVMGSKNELRDNMGTRTPPGTDKKPAVEAKRGKKGRGGC
jgi:hypothetical protein